LSLKRANANADFPHFSAQVSGGDDSSIIISSYLTGKSVSITGFYRVFSLICSNLQSSTSFFWVFYEFVCSPIVYSLLLTAEFAEQMKISRSKALVLISINLISKKHKTFNSSQSVWMTRFHFKFISFHINPPFQLFIFSFHRFRFMKRFFIEARKVWKLYDVRGALMDLEYLEKS
jgi:hypothetical protein